MAAKGKEKSKKTGSAKVAMKDLRVRKEQADKVKGGAATYGPETLS